MSVRHLILRLGQCGLPREWLTPATAASLLVRGQVIWSAGEQVSVLRGGRNRQGVRSRIDLPSIIATRGAVNVNDFSPALHNTLLFRRDRFVCLYCGQRFAAADLSRDHVFPRARGGADVWENVVTACKRCNQHKACRTPEEAQMPLLAVPYKPNLFEFAVLANHRILSDQMAFLQGGLSVRFLQKACEDSDE